MSDQAGWPLVFLGTFNGRQNLAVQARLCQAALSNFALSLMANTPPIMHAQQTSCQRKAKQKHAVSQSNLGAANVFLQLTMHVQTGRKGSAEAGLPADASLDR